MKKFKLHVFLFVLSGCLYLCGCDFSIGPDLPGREAEIFLSGKEPYSVIAGLRDCEPLSPERFLHLTRYSNRAVKRLLAENPSAQDSWLLLFSKNSDYYIRRGVAINTNVSPKLLSILVSDPNEYVRESAAANQNLPPGIYTNLISQEDEFVHHGLASNPSLSPEALSVLFAKHQDNHFFYTDFARNPKLPETIAYAIYLKEKNKSFSLPLDLLVLNPSVCAPLLLEIHRCAQYRVPLFRFAQNPNCPQEIKTLIHASGDSENIRILNETFSDTLHQ